MTQMDETQFRILLIKIEDLERMAIEYKKAHKVTVANQDILKHKQMTDYQQSQITYVSKTFIERLCGVQERCVQVAQDDFSEKMSALTQSSVTLQIAQAYLDLYKKLASVFGLDFSYALSFDYKTLTITQGSTVTTIRV